MQGILSTKKLGVPVSRRKTAVRRSALGGRRMQLQLLLLVAPVCIFLLLFHYVPIAGLWMAFTSFKPVLGIFGSPFVGLRNFEFIFRNHEWPGVLGNTVAYNLGMIASGTLFAVLFAVFCYEIRSKTIVRAAQTAFLVPYFVSWVTASILLYAFLNARLGIANRVLGALGVTPVNWYATPGPWPLLIVLTNIWKNTGYFTIIFYSALLGIDLQLFEQAAIDGCTRAQKILYVTLPSLLPVLVLNTLISIGYILYSDIGMFWVLPMRGLGGQPDLFLTGVTDVIQTFVYRRILYNAGDVPSYGMASAIGLLQSVAGFLLVMGANRLARASSRGEYRLF
jgi:putative aldouronate transport system permease protein